jgi:hypothetical protein
LASEDFLHFGEIDPSKVVVDLEDEASSKAIHATDTTKREKPKQGDNGPDV